MADVENGGQAGRVRDPEVRQGPMDSSGSSWLTLAGFAFLTFNSAMALFRSRDDPWSSCFVVGDYCALVLLFSYLRWVERLPASPRRNWMKSAVWSLTTLLTVMFAWKVATLLPLPVAGLVWLMAFAIASGFYAFFIHEEAVAE